VFEIENREKVRRNSHYSMCLKRDNLSRFGGVLRITSVLHDPERSERLARYNKIFQMRSTSDYLSTLAKHSRFARCFAEGEGVSRLTAAPVKNTLCPNSNKSSASPAVEEFFNLCRRVFPFPFQFVLTDNRSEFKKHFDKKVRDLHMTHYHTYPRTPKMNAEIERFNRTLSDAFIKQHRMLLAYDIDAFNEKLIDWLLWYNTRRPHWSLGLVSPLKYIVSTLTANESHMLWTDTSD